MACRSQQCRRRRRREGEGAKQERTLASPPSRPHFFKIVLSQTLESGKLGIPKSFLRRYGKDLEGSVLLKVPGGSTWPVELEKRGNDMVWLWKGWRKFMEHYSIGHGHVTVFKYEGDSIFHVIIFDKSASEIDYPLSIESDLSGSEGELLLRKEENFVEIEDSEGFVPCPWPSPNSSLREFGGQRRCTALESASQFESDHPFFKMVMRPTYIQSHLRIPSEFFRKHVQRNKQIATLRYSDRSWYVKLRRHEPLDMGCLSIGWSFFARETGLHVRDVCVFELVDRDNIVLRVSIFSSNGRIQIKQSQCRESSSESAFHTSSCLSPVNAHEKACKFESEYPFFNIVMCPSHLNRNHVTIPRQFIETHIQKDRRMATLVYLGRSFEVKLRVYRRYYNAYLGAGWSAFARETCLDEGDVCKFELVNTDNIVFRVSIIRSADKEVICVE
ncbi:B3 domain-containing transcription factor VRN1-like isoform X1 [Rhodamnia argentea]|uniref:B3 domain-containing transcription factor VRN1-like isoform X1 n=1 Tax=Rhodamnia argentea TaxID=178133 RepID=A0ABM3HWT7_9MYRT|nr:B3 domain-containing transcription factor VRN1-like isoform X1 [Rhodamnia argentea]